MAGSQPETPSCSFYFVQTFHKKRPLQERNIRWHQLTSKESSNCKIFQVFTLYREEIMINHMSTKVYIMHHELYFNYNSYATIRLLLLLILKICHLQDLILAENKLFNVFRLCWKSAYTAISIPKQNSMCEAVSSGSFDGVVRRRWFRSKEHLLHQDWMCNTELWAWVHFPNRQQVLQPVHAESDSLSLPDPGIYTLTVTHQLSKSCYLDGRAVPVPSLWGSWRSTPWLPCFVIVADSHLGFLLSQPLGAHSPSLSPAKQGLFCTTNRIPPSSASICRLSDCQRCSIAVSPLSCC